MLHLQLSNLNFDRSSLQVRFGILPSHTANYSVSDDTWQTPSDVSSIVNIVYTEDVTVLNATSYIVGGNNIAISVTQNDPLLDTSALQALGIKIQYNTDAPTGSPEATSWQDAVPTQIPQDKEFWIRFAPIDANYELGTDILDGEQITKLDVNDVKIALVLDAAWEAALAAAALEGKTYDFHWEVGKEIPKVPALDDGSIRGRVTFSLNDKLTGEGSYENTIQDTLSDYYGKGIRMFDKDRDEDLIVKFVINTADENDFIFTKPDGTEFLESELTRNVSIDELVQPIFTDVTGLYGSLPSSANNWLDFANSPQFKPQFIPGNRTDNADLERIVFNGQDVKLNTTESFYELDINPFDPSDIMSRDQWNALAPRNTKFQFSFRNTSSSGWSAWQDTPPVNVTRSTTFEGLRIRIVALDGFELPDATHTTFADQTWESSYNVVVEVNTTNVRANTAEFIGFNNVVVGEATGIFNSDDPDGNPWAGNPVMSFLQNGTQYDEFSKPVNQGGAFVLEYKVTTISGTDVLWEDEAGELSTGWHEFALPPQPTVPWYGNRPIKLDNGQVVHVRLRARDGFVIIDGGSTDIDPTGYSKWSAESNFPTISTLDTLIDPAIVETVRYYNPDSLKGLDGSDHTLDVTMPTVRFSGNETAGTVSINHGGTLQIANQFETKVFYLTPIVPDGQTILSSMDVNQKPKFGYEAVGRDGSRVVVYAEQSFVNLPIGHGITSTGWQDQFWLDEMLIWDPSAINTLSVGDAILPMMVAKDGYGFKWEDTYNSFGDIEIPKARAEKFINPNNGNGTTVGVPGNVLSDWTPIPVRGLLVVPDYFPAEADILYSSDPEEMINGNAKLSNSLSAPSDARWKFQYDIIRKSGGQKEYGLNRLPSFDKYGTPNNLHNGDEIIIKIVPINSAYEFDPSYIAAYADNTVTIAGLLENVPTVNIPRPIIDYGGYEGFGDIFDLQESQTGGSWVAYDRTNISALPEPQLDPSHASKGYTVIWEYQVIRGRNPENMPASEINAIAWTTDAPTNLSVNDWVRVRLASIDPDQVVFPYIYSEGSIDDKQGVDRHLSGWIRIEGLTLDTSKVDAITSITGYAKRTNFNIQYNTESIHGDQQTSDYRNASFEASKDGITWWTPDEWRDQTHPLRQLSNNEYVFIRAKANSGYVFDVNDADPTSGISFETDNGVTYLRKTEWDNILVKDLLGYLNISGVSINSTNVTRDARHPSQDEIDANVDGVYPPMTLADILSGYATVAETSITGGGTVRDIDNNTVDANGEAYSEKIVLKYYLMKFDADTGNHREEQTWNPSSGSLSNQDIIKIRVETNDSSYRVSQNVELTVTVEGLIQSPPKSQERPTLAFYGENGAGSVSVSPSTETGFRWRYLVWYDVENNPDAPDHTDELLWSNQIPVDLSNGDRVAVKLGSTIGGIIADDLYTGWVDVNGLTERIILSGVTVQAFDPDDPWKSYEDGNRAAFRLVGDQEGFATVEINMPLYSTDPNVEALKDFNTGLPIPRAEVLQWTFEVSNSEVPGLYETSYSLPKGLLNGQYLHIRLAPGEDQKEISVVGFKTITYEVQNLKPASTISNQLIIYVGAGAAGALVLASIAGILIITSSRKKHMI